MYEHPSYAYIRFEQAELERRAERHRFLAEHSDQIVPRRTGPIGRMLHRLGAASRRQDPRPVPCEPVAAR